MSFPVCAIAVALLLFHNIALTTSQADDLIVQNPAPKNNKSIDTISVETPYIIGGNDAKIEKYNYVAILRFSNRLICTCFIIAKRFVLTAAHCVVFDDQPQDPRNYSVVVGTSDSDGTGGTEYKVSNIIPHENYTSDGTHDDIALVELADDLVFGRNVGKICLPTTDMFKDSKCGPCKQVVVLIMGYGVFTEGSNEPAKTLQVATVRIFNLYCCKAIYRVFGIPVNDKHICVGGEDKNVCNGDSGSPTVYQNCAVGITSFGTSAGCAYPGIPDVCTKVYSYTEWITDHGVEYCECQTNCTAN